MTIVADKYGYVIGVDTHASSHTFAILTTKTGQIIGPKTFPTNIAGIARAITWITRTVDIENSIAAIEGVRSYGAILTEQFRAADITVCEATPPRRRARLGIIGKSDEIDAIAAAQYTARRPINQIIWPRSSSGIRASLAIVLAARRRMDAYRTVQRNALNALVRSHDLGIDARRALTDSQISTIAGWRNRTHDSVEQATARAEARYLAASILGLKRELMENRQQLAEVAELLAPGLQDLPGYGPVSVAGILVAYSHHGRFDNDAQFAALAGVAPLQASSGKTNRHRLNRYGDRHLNEALDVIARVRMAYHDETRQYVARQTSLGKSYREIKRLIKRYLARSTFRILEHYAIPA